MADSMCRNVELSLVTLYAISHSLSAPPSHEIRFTLHELGHDSLQQRIPLGPFTMSTVGIDVPRMADIDEGAPPSNRTMFGMGQRSERVIGAGDHEAPKSERAHRHRRKPARRGREACTLRIGHRHEKRALRS